MLREIQEHLNEHIAYFLGVVVVTVNHVTTKYDADFLITNGFVGLTFSVWIPIIGSVYIIFLIILLLPKLINKFIAGYKNVVNIFDEIGKRP